MTSATRIALSEIKTLPDFSAIQNEEIESAMKDLLAEVSGRFDAFEESVEPTWEGTIGALFDVIEPLNHGWRLVNLLMSAKNDPELRQAHGAIQPEIVNLLARISQSRPLYDALVELKRSSWSKLTDLQKRLVDARIREAELGGVALAGEQLARFKQIQNDLAALGTRFSNNVLDSSKRFSILLTERSQVAGIASPVLGVMAKSAAEDEGRSDFDPETGPWKVTLDGGVFLGVVRNADDRTLRERLLRAYYTRASKEPFDNKEIIQEILELRKEQASLLGFPDFAEMNFVRKMVDSAERVWEFLGEIREACSDNVRGHIESVTAFARESTGDPSFELQAWDLLYWSEKLREKLYGYSSEELRRFFPYEQVLDGLFDFCNRMFGVRLEPADGEGDTWDPSVRLFKVFDSKGDQMAYLYLDAFARPGEKRAGAWANFFAARHVHPDGSVQLPSAWLVCNQLPPVGGNPSLMSFVELRTLFHEVGHALHTMLTTVDFAWAAGNSNVEWDAVEIPSTLMENWCFDKGTLMAFARDYETGDPMPDELFEKIARSKTFGAGYTAAQTGFYSEIDLALHHRFQPGSPELPNEIVEKVMARSSVLPLPDDQQFLCGFAHIFDGGYAAGYYSYLWSQMLSADIYHAFLEVGRENAYEVGRRFRETILSLGGSRHPSEIFRQFRGRDPETGPLLEDLGVRSPS